MVDDKVEMNNDSENYTTANINDPKNVQELTQYVSLYIVDESNLKMGNFRYKVYCKQFRINFKICPIRFY